MDKRELTAIEKAENNFYDIQRMIYYDLPVLIGKIFHAAFANCECSTPVVFEDDIKFLEGFIETTERSFNIAIEGQKKQIAEMLKIHKKQEGLGEELDLIPVKQYGRYYTD